MLQATVPLEPVVPATVLQVTVPLELIIVFVVVAVVTFALGIYLLTTNPPKDPGTFIGFGKEKVPDEELEEWQREVDRERKERRERRLRTTKKTYEWEENEDG